MKRLILPLLCFFLLSYVSSAKIIEVPEAVARMSIMTVGGGVPAAELTCTVGSGDQWVQTVDNNTSGANSTETRNFQYVENSSSVSICKITCYLDEDDASTMSINMEIWSVTGTTPDIVLNAQIEGDSDIQTVDGAGSAEYTFSWSAGNEVEVTTNFAFIWDGMASNDLDIHYDSTDATHFTSSADNLHTWDAERSGDATCSIYYLQ